MSQAPDGVARRRAPTRASALWLAVLVAGSVRVDAEERPTATRPTAASPGPHVAAARSPALSFEENGGHHERDVLFTAQGRAYALRLTHDAIALDVPPAAGARDRTSELRIRFDPHSAATVRGERPQARKTYYASAGTNTLTGASHFDQVRYGDVYPGIDVVFHGDDARVQFDFEVAPGADPAEIRLDFSGTTAIEAESNGQLTVRAGTAALVLKKPFLFQEQGGTRSPVAGGYVVESPSTVRFAIGDYDPALPLVIDPTIEYATYLGGAGEERVIAIKANAAGETFVFGATSDRLAFPSTLLTGRPNASPEYCFLSKFDASGSNLLYSVIYLDTYQARCDAMTLGPNGQPYTVFTSVDGVFVKSLRAISEPDGVVTATRALLLGLEGLLPANAVEIDSASNLYVLGSCFNTRTQTPSPYPLAGGFHASPRPERCESLDDFFSTGLSESVLIKYNAATTPVYGTFVAGSADDEQAGRGLAVVDGVAYVGGRTRSMDLPVAGGPIQSACAGDDPASCEDGFLLVIDTNRTGTESLRYGTYLGGAGADGITAVAAGTAGVVTVAGQTASLAFPTAFSASNEPSQFVDASTGAAFAARLDPAQPPAGQLLFAKLIETHSVAADATTQLALLSDGAFAVAGMTEHDPFAAVEPLFTGPAGPGDALPFVSLFEPDGNALRFSSLLSNGGSHDPHIAVRGLDELYVAMTGGFESGSLSAFQPDPAGGNDALVLKISALAPPNEPPVLDEIITFIARATSIGGASLFVSASGLEPDRNPLTVTFTGPTGSSSYVLTDRPDDQFLVSAFLAFPNGTSTFTVRIDDGRGGIATGVGTVMVAGVVGNGTGVITVTPVPLLDNTFSFGDPFAPITRWTMESAAGTTLTTLNVRSDGTPPLPAGYQLGSPPYYYDFVTQPESSPYTACIQITGMSFAAPHDVRLFHHAAGAWTDVTTSVTTQEICGRVTTVGTFALLHPAVDANRATTIAGSGFGQHTLDGPGGDLRDDLVDGQPATASALGLGEGGLVFDATRGLLYMTTYTRIRRVNLHTGILDTIAGDGVVGSLQVDPITGVFGFPSVNGVDARTSHVTTPSQLALDAQGNIYFAETCQVRRVDRKTNIVTIVAGDGFCEHRGDGGLATAARTDMAHGPIAIDAAGNVLFGETGRIRRIDTAGLISTVAGNGSNGVVPGPALESGLTAYRFAFSPTGDLYIVQLDGRLMRLSAGADGVVNGGPGEAISVINACAQSGSCPASRFGGDGDVVRHATFRMLTSVAVEPNGDVLVGDYGDRRVRRISAGADGVLTGEADDEIAVTTAGYNAASPHGFFVFHNAEDFGLSSSIVTISGILVDPRGGFFYIDGNAGVLRRVGAAAPIPNNPPVANAGPDQTVDSQAGGSAIVHLDGRGSSDPEDDALTFVWSENGTPLGSGPELDVVLSEGSHVITLTVTDTAAHSASDTVTMTVGGLASVVIEITETITVTDAPNVLPARMVNIAETITIADTPTVLPAAMVDVTEAITVTDAPTVGPAVMVNVSETIHVADDVALTVTGADLSIAVFAAPNPVDLGATLRHTVTLTNNGPAIGARRHHQHAHGRGFHARLAQFPRWFVCD